MLGIAQIGGSVSNSKVEMKSCNMVIYFLVANVFFLTLISGSLLNEIGESVTHPRDFPSHLARAVSAQVKPSKSLHELDFVNFKSSIYQIDLTGFTINFLQADFFMTYTLVGLSGFSLEALQAGMLLLDFIKSHTCSRSKENPHLYSLPYLRVIP